MGAVRMRVQTADKNITIIHTTPVHQFEKLHTFIAEHPLLSIRCKATFLQIWWRNKLLDGLRVTLSFFGWTFPLSASRKLLIVFSNLFFTMRCLAGQSALSHYTVTNMFNEMHWSIGESLGGSMLRVLRVDNTRHKQHNLIQTLSMDNLNWNTTRLINMVCLQRQAECVIQTRF